MRSIDVYMAAGWMDDLGDWVVKYFDWGYCILFLYVYIDITSRLATTSTDLYYDNELGFGW